MIEFRITRYGAEYDAEALRRAIDRRGMTTRRAAHQCGMGHQEMERLLNPYPGRRTHWKTLNRLRKALDLTDEEVKEIWSG